MKRILNNEQVKQAYEIYVNEKLSTYEIGDIFNCSAYVIQREFKKAGLIVRNNSHARQKYPINENIFDIIDCEEKAYWLGFLYADGNVSKTNRVRLSLAEEDREIVEKFSNFIFNCERVKYYEQPRDKKSQNLVYVDVCNKHIAKKLTDLGCPPKKTFILKFPDWLNYNLYNHFIRGYFDGDGCLSNYKSKQKGRGKFTLNSIINEYEKSEISILSTKEFLEFLQNLFLILEINSSISKRHKNRNNNNFTLKVSGNLQLLKLLNWLYQDATLYLQRKFNKFLEFKQMHETL